MPAGLSMFLRRWEAGRAAPQRLRFRRVGSTCWDTCRLSIAKRQGQLDDSLFDPRSRPCRGRRHACRRAPEFARPRAPCRGARLSPFLAGRAPQHGRDRERRDLRRDRLSSPAERRRSASAPAASCCRTIRRSSSPSSSARSPRSIPAASTSGSAARRAQTRLRCARSAAIRWRPRPFRRTCSSCRRCSGRCSRARSCAPCPAPVPTCRSTSSGRASSARSSRRCSAFPTPSRRTSRRTR